MSLPGEGGPAAHSEWQVGWRIVAACAVANGTGVSLMFYTFSMFLLPMAAELHLTRGQTGIVQSMIITAALGAPLVGRLTDRLGFRKVFIAATVGMTLVELGLARWVGAFAGLAFATALTGFIGGGATTVLLTRPVNAHFRRFRGIALGIVGAGASLATIVVPPFLERVITLQGWRAGFVTLGAIALVIGLPVVLALMPRGAATQRIARPALATGSAPSDWSFLRMRDFWLLTVANVLAALATSGTISQLSPMIQEEGLGPATAALGLSAFAAGQLIGKLGGGLLLDRVEPRLVATVLTAVPAVGFLVLWMNTGLLVPVLLAAALIGLLHGADIGIFAFFVARRFDVSRYGTVFGAMHGMSWIGTAAGVTLFGVSFDKYGSYGPIQLASVVLLVLAAALFPLVKLDSPR